MEHFISARNVLSAHRAINVQLSCHRSYHLSRIVFIRPSRSYDKSTDFACHLLGIPQCVRNAYPNGHSMESAEMCSRDVTKRNPGFLAMISRVTACALIRATITHGTCSLDVASGIRGLLIMISRVTMNVQRNTLYVYVFSF